MWLPLCCSIVKGTFLLMIYLEAMPQGSPCNPSTNWPTSRGDPWVALLVVALLAVAPLGYLTRASFQHFIVGQRKLLEVLLKARGQVRRLQIIRFLFFPRIARDE